MKNEPFQPESYYLLENVGNNDEYLFYEPMNCEYFLRLYERHAEGLADLLACYLSANSYQLLIRIKPEAQIPDKYKDRMHLPLSHLFNAYAKGFNKKYGRVGSLFREHFSRTKVDRSRVPTIVKKFRIKSSRKVRTVHEISYFSTFNTSVFN